jgi:hypothetical protein
LGASESEKWGSPVAVADDEERDAVALAGGPLRVEVEIVEEVAAQTEVVATEIIIHEEMPEAAADVVLRTTPSAEREWGDLLIALWLVLVASAVIASLFWRR